MSDQIESGILPSTQITKTSFITGEAIEAVARANRIAKTSPAVSESNISAGANLFTHGSPKIEEEKINSSEQSTASLDHPSGENHSEASIPILKNDPSSSGDSAIELQNEREQLKAQVKDEGLSEDQTIVSASTADSEGEVPFPECLTVEKLGEWFHLPPADRRALKSAMPKLNLSNESLHRDDSFAKDLHQALKADPSLRFELNHVISNFHKGAKGKQRSLLWQVLEKCGKKLSATQRQELRENTKDFQSHTKELLKLLSEQGEVEAVAIATWALASPPGRWQADAPDEDTSGAESVKKILELLHSVHVSTSEMGKRLKKDWYHQSFVELYDNTMTKLLNFKVELDRAKTVFQTTEVKVKYASISSELGQLVATLKTLSNPTALQQVERIIAKIEQKPSSEWTPSTIDTVVEALDEVQTVMKKRAEIDAKLTETAVIGEAARSKGDRESAKIALQEQSKLVESDLDQIDLMNACLNRIESTVKHEVSTWEAEQKSAENRAKLPPEKEFEILLQTVEHERDQARSELNEFKQTINALRTRINHLEMKLESGRNGNDETPIPDNFEELESWSQIHLAGKVAVLPRAIRSAKKSEFENIELAYRALICLRDYQYPMRIEGGTERVEAYRNATQELRLQDENTFPGNRATLQGDTYFVEFAGQRRLLERHLKGSNSRDPRHCFRLYYFWDDETKMIVVGSLPNHLPTEVT